MFPVPQVENAIIKLYFADVAKIQKAVTEELKKAQKEEFSAASQVLYDRAKACIYMPMELRLNKNGYVFSSCVLI